MEEKQKVNYKKCPNCQGWIPDTWKKHNRCGWTGGEVELFTAADQIKIGDEATYEKPKVDFELIGINNKVYEQQLTLYRKAYYDVMKTGFIKPEDFAQATATIVIAINNSLRGR